MKQLALIQTVFILLCGITSFGQELTKELAWAIKYNQTDYLDRLVTDEKLNDCLSTGKSKTYNVLAMSIKLNSLKSLVYFLNRGADIENACEDKTPLMYAAKYNKPEMLRLLVDRGADPTKTVRGKSALHFARKFQNYEIVRILRSYSN